MKITHFSQSENRAKTEQKAELTKLTYVRMVYSDGMEAVLKRFAPAQIPLALMFVAVLAYDAYLRSTTGEGFGAPTFVLEVLALAAGALGVKRPSEAAEGLSKHL